MVRRKTHEEFVMEVKELVGDEYTVLGEYKTAKTKIEIKHMICGMIYEISPTNFLSGIRCAKCANARPQKSQKTTEDFIRDVEDLEGGEYTVLGEYKTAHIKIKMRHNSCGYVYEIKPNAFLCGRRCKLCNGNEASRKTDEDFKQEVFKMYGNEYVVLGNYVNNFTKISISHSICGNEWSVTPLNFRNGRKCPTCAIEASRLSPIEFKNTVHQLVGDEYSLCTEYKNMTTKVLMKHNSCGNMWEVSPPHFLNGTRCPRCKVSKGELRISEFLKKAQIPFIFEHKFNDCVDKLSLRFDFYVQGVAIEYDGEQHYRAVDFWGGEEGFRDTQRRDRIKDKYCADNGIPLIRIPYWDYDKIDEILSERLLPLLEERASQRK